MTIFRIAVAIFSLLLIFFGLVTAITPIPFGLPLVLIGFLLLATSSPTTLKFIRKRWGWLDRRLRWFQRNWPRRMTRALRRSDPYPDEDDEDDEATESGRRDAAMRGAAHRR